MHDEASSSPGGGTPTRSEGSARVQALISSGQRLVDTPRPAVGDSLAWYIEAQFVGDLSAIAAAALHTISPAPPAG
jgi:hypothetical protein